MTPPTPPPTTLILRTAGTNCDAELAHAFHLAGSATQTVHLNALIESPHRLADFDILAFPGGFSYGDDIAAGRIFANRLKHRLEQPLRDAVTRGVPIIGICNGFQVLVKLGLLPDPASTPPHTTSSSTATTQTVTLSDNTSGRFTDRWVNLTTPPNTACLWTQNLGDYPLPIAHGEGRFTAPASVLDTLEQNNQIALKYAADDNPNGSARDIAGICDPTGRVFGLMPHPERYTDITHHPAWTRLPTAPDQTTPGLKLFQNAVRHVTHSELAPSQ